MRVNGKGENSYSGNTPASLARVTVLLVQVDYDEGVEEVKKIYVEAIEEAEKIDNEQQRDKAFGKILNVILSDIFDCGDLVKTREEEIVGFEICEKINKHTGVSETIKQRAETILLRIVDKAIARGEKIDELVEKSKDLSASAKTFWNRGPQRGSCVAKGVDCVERFLKSNRFQGFIHSSLGVAIEKGLKSFAVSFVFSTVLSLGDFVPGLKGGAVALVATIAYTLFMEIAKERRIFSVSDNDTYIAWGFSLATIYAGTAIGIPFNGKASFFTTVLTTWMLPSPLITIVA